MATSSPSRNGQSYRLTESGWASQKNVLPFWREDEQNFKSNLPETEPSSGGDCLYAGGLNIRVPDNPESETPPADKLVRVVTHDHSYFKKSTAIKRRQMKVPDRVDSMVMKALANVPCENTRKGEVSDQVKNTQLYKYLVTPIDYRRQTGEAFGHNMVREIIASASYPSKNQVLPPVPSMIFTNGGFGKGIATTYAAAFSPEGKRVVPNGKSLATSPPPKKKACTTRNKKTPGKMAKKTSDGRMQPTILSSILSESVSPKVGKVPATMKITKRRAPTRTSKPRRPLLPQYHKWAEPKLPPPDFVDLPCKFWTTDQCHQYEEWWQQLPSCQYS